MSEVLQPLLALNTFSLQVQLVPPPERAKPARKSAGCGVGDGSRRPHPPAATATG